MLKTTKQLSSIFFYSNYILAQKSPQIQYLTIISYFALKTRAQKIKALNPELRDQYKTLKKIEL